MIQKTVKFAVPVLVLAMLMTSVNAAAQKRVAPKKPVFVIVHGGPSPKQQNRRMLFPSRV